MIDSLECRECYAWKGWKKVTVPKLKRHAFGFLFGRSWIRNGPILEKIRYVLGFIDIAQVLTLFPEVLDVGHYIL